MLVQKHCRMSICALFAALSGACALPESDAHGSAVDATNSEQQPLTVGSDVNTIPIDPMRSIMVTDLNGFALVKDRYPLGKLLGEAADHFNAKTGAKYNTRGDWVTNPFADARDEFNRHNDSADDVRIGVVDYGNPYNRLLRLWPELANTPNNIGAGPFRLLAVVNRLDAAGDLDARGLHPAARDPRTFGEGRLIFGLVDPNHESNTGNPYPMTLIIEYRLPALDSNLNVIPNYDYRAAMGTDQRAQWQVQMERWGKVWRELSRWSPTTAAYQDHLAGIVNRFTNVENFIAIRSTSKLVGQAGNPEFELREWYILQTQQTLIPRKPRDEPYRCASTGEDLGKIAAHYWVPDRLDLKKEHLDPNNLANEIGYTLPRDAGEYPVGGLANPIRGCPVNSNGVPKLFEQADTDTLGNDGIKHRVTAPFGRVKENEVWALPGQGENMRHALAMATCTGCHSKEAGLFGFHVAPRMPNTTSALSRFLRGGSIAVFQSNGVSYNYNELTKRKNFLQRASTKDSTLAPYDGLWRSDRM